jgi:hypothetical protein
MRPFTKQKAQKQACAIKNKHIAQMKSVELFPL